MGRDVWTVVEKLLSRSFLVCKKRLCTWPELMPSVSAPLSVQKAQLTKGALGSR
jgi:hypothetical protein